MLNPLSINPCRLIFSACSWQVLSLALTILKCWYFIDHSSIQLTTTTKIRDPSRQRQAGESSIGKLTWIQLHSEDPRLSDSLFASVQSFLRQRLFGRILSWSNWPRDKFDSLKIGFELDYGAMDSALACNANGPGSISMTSKCFFLSSH